MDLLPYFCLKNIKIQIVLLDKKKKLSLYVVNLESENKDIKRFGCVLNRYLMS